MIRLFDILENYIALIKNKIINVFFIISHGIHQILIDSKFNC